MSEQGLWASPYRFLLAPIFIVLLNYSNYSTGILVGDQVDWTRYGWLVKVLARNEEGTVQACSGSLISTTLVLTAAECVLNRVTRRSLNDFAVITKTTGVARTYSGSLLEANDDKSWALIKIAKQNISEICPPKPAPKRITRLNIRPSLTEPSMFEITLTSPCHLIGFETVPNATEFGENNRIRRLSLSKLMSPDRPGNFHRSLVTKNYTACFDDTGLPLICSTLYQGSLQVGIFQALSFPEDGESSHMDVAALEMCPLATGMEFSMLHTDDSLVRALQNHDINEVVSTYKACGFA